MKYLMIAIGSIGIFTLFAGCQTTPQGGRSVHASQARTAMQSFHGRILHVSEVQIVHDETGVGAAAGGILGGIAGSTVGSGRGSRLATAGGAALGAAAGSSGERARSTRPAWELEVELEDGRIMVIVQEKDDEFDVGDHVRVIESRDGTLRVRQ